MVSQVKKEARPRSSLPPRVTDTSGVAGGALTGHRKRNRALICNRVVEWPVQRLRGQIPRFSVT